MTSHIEIGGKEARDVLKVEKVKFLVSKVYLNFILNTDKILIWLLLQIL
jgi:hypothetical protein